jgi:hypothetical protein
MLRALRYGLLALFFLLAQAGALAHGIGHGIDVDLGDGPACEQCMAYAPMGAGAASSPPAWSAPAQLLSFHAAVPAASFSRFQACYQSRAPPRPHR